MRIAGFSRFLKTSEDLKEVWPTCSWPGNE